MSWARDGDFVMDASADYWGAKATIGRVTMRTIPEAGTRVAALLAGDADIITAVPPDEIDRINKSGKTRALTLPGNRIPFYMIAVRQAPLNNKLVRQALNHGSNMDGIIKTILGGHGFRRAVISNPWHVGFDASIKPYLIRSGQGQGHPWLRPATRAASPSTCTPSRAATRRIRRSPKPWPVSWAKSG